jgi:hypothetical protein
MAGSQATAGLSGGAVRDSGQHTSSELTRLGPASARRVGPQQGEGFSAHLALWTRRRGGGDEQRGMAWSRGSRAARSMASTATSPLCSSPAPWRSGEAVRLGEGATPASSSGFRRRRRPSAAQAGGAAVQAPSPPSLLLLTHGETAAPTSWRLRPPVRLLHSSHLPLLPRIAVAARRNTPRGSYAGAAADFGGKIPKVAARRTGRPADRGWGFIGRRLGF